jgi:DNA-binding transcriptional MerR regulator
MAGEDAVQEISIGVLAREFGVTTRTIRYYEDEELLSPERHGQKRVYGPRERVRLRLILRGKRLGFSIAEIREILDMYDSDPGEAGQLRHLTAKIAERRAALERQRADIDQTLADLAEIEARCQQALAAMKAGERRVS